MNDKAPLFVDDSVQRRLTLAGMFAHSVGVLSEEQVAWFLKNENRPQVPELVSIAVNLGRDQRLALTESVKTDSPRITIPSALAQEWGKVWKEQYGIKADFSGLQIPRQPLGYKARFIVMHEKLAQSPEALYQSDARFYGGKVWRFTNDNLDETAPLHKPFAKLLAGTFAFWAADAEEAPDGLVGGDINLNTAAVDEIGWITESLPMRQVHGRKHWLEHKKHLDRTVWTFCAGSRLSDGVVPCVYLGAGDGTVDVHCVDPRYAAGDVRFRRAVV